MEPVTDLLALYAKLQRALTQERDAYEADRQALLAPLAEELAELETNHREVADRWQAELAGMVDQIKAAALVEGRSIKAHGWHAVVTAGRASWDDAWLQGYAATHDEILQARREGRPSVSIREAR